MDGLVCAVLLKEIDIVDDILFVHPKDMQDGLIEVTSNDIITNLPYVENAHLVFDHHASEMMRVGGSRPNHILDPHAPSAARVVYDYYGGRQTYQNLSLDMMKAVDKIDAANLSKDEILKPDGWILLGYLMDARTGLGRFRHFRISNYQLMMDLIDYCREKPILKKFWSIPMLLNVLRCTVNMPVLLSNSCAAAAVLTGKPSFWIFAKKKPSMSATAL